MTTSTDDVVNYNLFGFVVSHDKMWGFGKFTNMFRKEAVLLKLILEKKLEPPVICGKNIIFMGNVFGEPEYRNDVISNDGVSVRFYDKNGNLLIFAGTYLQIMTYLSMVGEIPAWLIDFSNYMSSYFIHDDYDIIFELSPMWLKTLINFNNVLLTSNKDMILELIYRPGGKFYNKIFNKYKNVLI